MHRNDGCGNWDEIFVFICVCFLVGLLLLLFFGVVWIGAGGGGRRTVGDGEAGTGRGWILWIDLFLICDVEESGFFLYMSKGRKVSCGDFLILDFFLLLLVWFSQYNGFCVRVP